MSINGIGTAGYPAWYESRKAENSTKGNFGANVKAASSAKNVVHIDPDALFSIHDAKTGESANVYKADNYSEDNPLYLVKGIDKNGNEYEQTVDVRKVNPNSCSYTEMLALNAHTGNKSDSNIIICQRNLYMGYDGMAYNDNSNDKNNWSIRFSEDTYKLFFEWLE